MCLTAVFTVSLIAARDTFMPDTLGAVAVDTNDDVAAVTVLTRLSASPRQCLSGGATRNGETEYSHSYSY